MRTALLALLLTSTAHATTTGSACTTDDGCPPGWVCAYRCGRLITTPGGEVSQHCTQGVCEEYRASRKPQEPPALGPDPRPWWKRLWAWLVSQLLIMQERP